MSSTANIQFEYKPLIDMNENKRYQTRRKPESLMVY